MDAGTGGVTSICGTAALGSLTAGETAQLCNDTYAYFGRTISEPVFCKWQGIQVAATSSPMSDAEVQSECAQYEMSCEDGDAGSDAGISSDVLWAHARMGGSTSDCFCGPIDSSCTATVAQYAQCMSDWTMGLITTVNGFPACSGLGLSDVSLVFTAEGQSNSTLDGGTEPSSCAALLHACPSLTPVNPGEI